MCGATGFEAQPLGPLLDDSTLERPSRLILHFSLIPVLRTYLPSVALLSSVFSMLGGCLESDCIHARTRLLELLTFLRNNLCTGLV